MAVRMRCTFLATGTVPNYYVKIVVAYVFMHTERRLFHVELNATVCLPEGYIEQPA